MRDAAGNITSSSGFQIPSVTTADAGDTGYSYTANRLVSTAGRSYLYDSDGNILSDGIRTFVYNQDNRLVRVSIGGNVVGEYAYDAFGRRTKKIASGITTLYHYDSAGKLIAETDGNGNPQRDYIYMNGEPAAVRIYGTQAGMYFFINDHLGTPQKIVNSSAQVVWAAAYLPFGKAQVTTETVANNFRFPGQYSDAESGLHYNWHRYYDPDTGRYLTPDPIGLEGGVNLYAYVMGNPVNRIDPEGLQGAMPVTPGVPMFPPVLPPVFIPGTPENQLLVNDVNKILMMAGNYLEASIGNQADSGIEQWVASIQSKAVLDGFKRPDRCKVLEDLIAKGEISALEAKSTLKDWGCRPSRQSKDKCKK